MNLRRDPSRDRLASCVSPGHVQETGKKAISPAPRRVLSSRLCARTLPEGVGERGGVVVVDLADGGVVYSYVGLALVSALPAPVFSSLQQPILAKKGGSSKPGCWERRRERDEYRRSRRCEGRGNEGHSPRAPADAVGLVSEETPSRLLRCALCGASSPDLSRGG